MFASVICRQTPRQRRVSHIVSQGSATMHDVLKSICSVPDHGKVNVYATSGWFHMWGMRVHRSSLHWFCIQRLICTVFSQCILNLIMKRHFSIWSRLRCVWKASDAPNLNKTRECSQSKSISNGHKRAWAQGPNEWAQMGQGSNE